MATTEGGTDLWLGGMRRAGERRLGDADAMALETRLRQEHRTVRRAHLVSRVLTATVVLAIATYVAFKPDDSGPLLCLFVGLGAAMMALGPLGALLEIAFAPRPATRVLFGVAALVSGFGWWNGGESVLGGLAIGVFCIVVVMGGGAMLFLRWRERRTRLTALGLASVDVHQRTVLVFEAPAREQEEEEEEQDDGPRRAEVLPLSTLLYRVDEELSALLPRVAVATVAVPPRVDLGDHPERVLSPAEREELARALPRLVRATIGQALFTLWSAGALMRFLSRGHPGLVPLGWAAVAAYAAFAITRRVRFHRRLAADLAAATVTRRRERGPAGEHLVELLPRAGIAWTIDGLPAAWRIS